MTYYCKNCNNIVGKYTKFGINNYCDYVQSKNNNFRYQQWFFEELTFYK